MSTPEAIKRRLNTAEDLRSIVRTMKTLAAVNIRQYEDAVVALADYARTVEYGFQVLLQTRPERVQTPQSAGAPTRLGAIVLGSDHGLCGAFNEQVAALFLQRHPAAPQAGPEPLIALGARVAGRLEDAGRSPAAVMALPASVVRIPAVVRDLLEQVAAWRVAGTVDGVRVYFNAPHGREAGHEPRVELLLPLDEDRLRALAAAPWRPRALPFVASDWDALFAVVVQQHLFVTLHRAIALSLAGENASRLVAMHAAERNIDERLDSLRGEFHRQRQTAITTELLDIVSGYEAQMSDGR